EDLSGAEIIRAFGKEEAFVARFRLSLTAWLASFNAAQWNNSMYIAIPGIFSALAGGVLLALGAGGVLHTLGVSIGTLAAFLLLFQAFFTPIVNLGNQWQVVQTALAGAERIFAVLALPEEDTAPERALSVSQTHPDARTAPATIEMKDVTFGYLPGQPV